MKHSEYVGLEMRLKGHLARADQRRFLIHDTITSAGAMALVLTIADATPWSLGDDRPIARLVFILVWSVAMASWQLSRFRRSQHPQVNTAGSTPSNGVH